MTKNTYQDLKSQEKNFHICLEKALQRMTDLKKDGVFIYHYRRRLLAQEAGLLE